MASDPVPDSHVAGVAGEGPGASTQAVVPFWYFKASEVYDYIVFHNAVFDHTLSWSWAKDVLQKAAKETDSLSTDEVASLIHEFDTLDQNHDGNVTRREWLAFFERKHASQDQNGGEQTHEGDKWVTRHCSTLLLASMSEKERKLYFEAKDMLVLESHEDIEEVYDLVAAKHAGKVTDEACLDSGIDKEVAAGLDHAGTGTISVEAWNSYFQTRHNELEKDHLGEGDRWLHNLMHTVRCSLLSPEEVSKLHAETKAALLGSLRGTYRRLVTAISPSVNVLRKQDLVVAMSGNFHLFEKVDTVYIPP